MFELNVAIIKKSLGVQHGMGYSPLEITILHSCFLLPNYFYLVNTCPSTHISQATMEFDVATREALESILGGPLSMWFWLKASLPCNSWRIYFRSTSFHGPATFLASSSCSQTLVRKILRCTPDPSFHMSSMMTSLHLDLLVYASPCLRQTQWSTICHPGGPPP